ncbi:MAG: DUF4956 domain-containing protein [Myxococcota bacterium]
MENLIGANEFFDAEDFIKLVARLALNLVFASLVIRRYMKLYDNHAYRFTYVLFNVITFALCFLLRKVPIELGFALGLFAVFGILRYRTEPIRMRDLTYLFVVIGIAILNAVANKKVTVAELLLVNVAIVGAVLILERRSNHLERHEVLYDKLELLRGEEAALLADLSERLGVDVKSVRVRRYDLLRDVAVLEVAHRKEPS